MKRIDSVNARPDENGLGKAGFNDNADLPGQDATYVTPGWFNTVQEELCNLLELRGISLNPESKRQLYDLLSTQTDLEALATEIENNFIRKNQIADDLTTSDATKVASANTVKTLQDNKLDKTALNNTLRSTSIEQALTAAQGKVLQDNKLGKTENAATATKLATARTIAISGAVTGTATPFDGSENIAIATTDIDGSKISTGTIPAARLPAASASAAGAVKVNDTLTSISTTEALTAAMGKKLQDEKADLSLFNSSFESNAGYQKIAGGFIIQWGYIASVNLDAFAVTFPIAFPNKCVFASADVYNRVADQHLRAIPTHTTTGMSGNINGGGNHPVKWLAMGF